jgi:hypothetical protein
LRSGRIGGLEEVSEDHGCGSHGGRLRDVGREFDLDGVDVSHEDRIIEHGLEGVSVDRPDTAERPPGEDDPAACARMRSRTTASVGMRVFAPNERKAASCWVDARQPVCGWGHCTDRLNPRVLAILRRA